MTKRAGNRPPPDLSRKRAKERLTRRASQPMGVSAATAVNQRAKGTIPGVPIHERATVLLTWARGIAGHCQAIIGAELGRKAWGDGWADNTIKHRVGELKNLGIEL